MKTLPPHHLGLATALAFLAGCVDGAGFSLLGGLFVSFMSGNSTRLGVSLAAGDFGHIVQIASLIGSFVVGAGLGYFVAQRAGARRHTAVLVTEAACLLAAVGAGLLGSGSLAGMAMALAMGIENATFLDEGGDTRINLTFMTGALVRLGQNLAALTLGEPRPRWWAHGLLWVGLTAGACAGAVGYRSLGVLVLLPVSGLLILIGLGFRPASIEDLR